MSLTSRTARFGLLLAALAVSACDKVPLLAPTNTTIRLVSSVGVLPLSGSTEITAVVIESAGTPVQNGTVVTFTSSIGNFEPREARTQNGQASVRFQAGSQSGKATISAFSGGSKSENVEILVGASAAGAVTLRATAGDAASNGVVGLVATVFDTAGNPLPNAPVAFSATSGTLSQSTVFSNEAGEARSSLTTTSESTVTATVGAGTTAVKGELKITVPVITLALANSPSGANRTEVGVPTVFSIAQGTGSTGTIRSVVIDFGDGGSRTLGALTGTVSVSYQYSRTGFYTVTATATDPIGQVSVATLALQVTDRFSIPAFVTVPSSTPGGLALLTADATPRENSSIRSFEWDFGDGESAVTTGRQTTHRYRAVGFYRVRLRVVATNGDEGYWEGDIRISSIL